MIESAWEQLCGYGFRLTDLYELTVAELLLMLKGCREQLSYKIWKQAYLIARACFDKNYPQTHEDANPELIDRPTLRVDSWVVEGADNYVGKRNSR